MILRRGNLSRSRRIILGLVVLVYIILLFFGLRIWTNDLIINPLERTIQVQEQVLQAEGITEQDAVSDIIELTESPSHEGRVDYALIHENQLLWESFQDSNRLQLIRSSLREVETDGIYSRASNRGYTVVAPLTIEAEDYQLIKFYPKSLFGSERQEINIRIALVILSTLLLLGFLHKWVKWTLTEPIQSLTEGIEKLNDGDYSYEYMGPFDNQLDPLGRAMTQLSVVLRDRKSVLEASRQRLSLLLDHLNLGVILIDQSGAIQLMNPEAKAIINLEEIPPGRSYQSLLKSYSLIDMIDKAIAQNQQLNEEIEVFIPQSRFIDVTIIPYSDKLIETDSVLVLLYDITQIRRLETIRTEFVANASHELRTPVTAIKGFTETLLNGAMESPELNEKFISIIYKESNRLEILINDILELSRVEKQVEQKITDPVNLATVLERVMNVFHEAASEKGISLRMVGDADFMLFVDEHRLEQIFINLIENGINYSDKGGEIEVRVGHDDEMVSIEVKDQGMGIPPEDQARVFERFYRVDKGRSRHSGGTGLGLSIVRNLLKNLGGTISLESTQNVGSTFTVKLPLHPPSEL